MSSCESLTSATISPPASPLAVCRTPMNFTEAARQYIQRAVAGMLLTDPSVGIALADSLDALISSNEITPQLAIRIMERVSTFLTLLRISWSLTASEYDKAVCDVLQKQVKAKASFKGRLHTYVRPYVPSPAPLGKALPSYHRPRNSASSFISAKLRRRLELLPQVYPFDFYPQDAHDL